MERTFTIQVGGKRKRVTKAEWRAHRREQLQAERTMQAPPAMHGEPLSEVTFTGELLDAPTTRSSTFQEAEEAPRSHLGQWTTTTRQGKGICTSTVSRRKELGRPLPDTKCRQR